MSLPAKIVVFLLIVVGIGASSLWILGGKKNEYSTSLVIDAQPQQVFPYLTQPDHMKTWIEGLDEVSELVKPPEKELPAPPVTTARIVRTADGKQVRYQDQIIRFDPGKLVSVQSKNRSQVVTSIYQLEAKEDDKTALTYKVKTKNRGVGRILAPLSTADIQLQMEQDARRLKELVEKNESPAHSEARLEKAMNDLAQPNESTETINELKD